MNCGDRFDFEVLSNRAVCSEAKEAEEQAGARELKSWAHWLARIP